MEIKHLGMTQMLTLAQQEMNKVQILEGQENRLASTLGDQSLKIAQNQQSRSIDESNHIKDLSTSLAICAGVAAAFQSLGMWDKFSNSAPAQASVPYLRVASEIGSSAAQASSCFTKAVNTQKITDDKNDQDYESQATKQLGDQSQDSLSTASDTAKKITGVLRGLSGVIQDEKSAMGA